MKREEIIAMLEEELTKVHKQIEVDEDITEEQRESLLSTSNSLLESLEEAKVDETANLQLQAICAMFGKDFDDLLDSKDDGNGDPLSALANGAESAEDDGSIRSKPVWQKIRHILRDEMSLKNILYSEDDEELIFYRNKSPKWELRTLSDTDKQALAASLRKAAEYLTKR